MGAGGNKVFPLMPHRSEPIRTSFDRIENLDLDCRQIPSWEQAILATGAVFQPELIRLMHSVLEESSSELPEVSSLPISCPARVASN